MRPRASSPTFLLAAVLAGALAGCLERGPTEPDRNAPWMADPSLPSSALAAPKEEESRVFTRNMYLGADISPLLAPGADPVEAATAIWDEIQHTDYPARALRLALEIARLEPHLVGLQEVTRFTIGPIEGGFPETVLLDFLEVLQLHLGALGQSYSVAVRQGNAQVGVPVMVGEQLMTIGYQDADAILVRDGVATVNAHGAQFAAQPPLEFTAGIPFVRGWTSVDARVGGGWIRFVNTHLEIQSFAAVQVAQTAELLAALASSPHPVVLVGDFNSAANPSAPEDRETPSYQMIRDAGFDDLWTRRHDADDGLTCCHESDLGNEVSTFDQRLDLVFARNVPGFGGGFAGRAFLEVVGGDLDDRFTTVDDVDLWPSDHAGVAASLWLPPGLFTMR